MANDLPIIESKVASAPGPEVLELNTELLANWLVNFLRDECIVRRNVRRAILGISGGVDSAVVAALCAKAFGPENTFVFRMPYKISSSDSLDHAQLVIDQLGLVAETISITDMVDGYVTTQSEPNATRIGNICARCRTAILFDQSARLGGLPIGTGNKSERLFGYYTWHADDAPPINPLGDLFKTQVWDLANYLEIPDVIVNKPASADLVKGQTDEGDFGISYRKADVILHYLTIGYSKSQLLDLGFDSANVEIVWRRVEGTHWKRHMPTVAVVSNSAINEFYLRPVDY